MHFKNMVILFLFQFSNQLFFSYRYSRRIPTVVSLISAGLCLATLAFVQYWGKYSHVRMCFIYIALPGVYNQHDIYKIDTEHATVSW